MVAPKPEDEDEDQTLALALAAFSGGTAVERIASLAEERAVRCGERLAALTAGTVAQRRARLAAALGARVAPALPGASPDWVDLFVERLAGERPALIGLALADLPAARAAEVASRLGVAPSRPAAPAPAVHTWLRKRLWGELAG